MLATIQGRASAAIHCHSSIRFRGIVPASFQQGQENSHLVKLSKKFALLTSVTGRA